MSVVGNIRMISVVVGTSAASSRASPFDCVKVSLGQVERMAAVSGVAALRASCAMYERDSRASSVSRTCIGRVSHGPV